MLINPEENVKPCEGTHAPSDAACFVKGESPVMRSLERVIADIAPTDIPVLLVGESGTGKEAMALEIHRRSSRSNEAFLKWNCESSDLLPTRQLFNGNSSDGKRPAGNGTLFLDEISQLGPASQTDLLHLLPDGDWVSSERSRGARLISATARNLENEMREGRLRQELYYRINGISLRLPSLRQRKEDIPALLAFFLRKYASLFNRQYPQLRSVTMDLLVQHAWPGNVRELENVARKIVALGDEELALSDLSPSATAIVPHSVVKSAARNPKCGGRSLKEAAREASRKVERDLILTALDRTHWNRKRTARELQISYKALLYKLKQLNLEGT